MGILEKLGITEQNTYYRLPKNLEFNSINIGISFQFFSYSIWPTYSEMLEVLINRVRIEIESNKSNIPENMIEDIYADEIKIIEKAAGKPWDDIRKLM